MTTDSAASGELLILGVGNLIAGDDGVGVHAVRHLLANRSAMARLPSGVQVVDGGTLGISLLPLLERADALVLVDAMELEEDAGTVRVLRGDEIRAHLAQHLSVHQAGVADLLAVSSLVGRAPRQVRLVGVQPGPHRIGTELSPAVAAVLPFALRGVEDAIWEMVIGSFSRVGAGGPGGS